MPGSFNGPHKQKPFDPKTCWWGCESCEVWWKGDPVCWQCDTPTERWTNYMGSWDGMIQRFTELPSDVEAGTVL